MKSAALVSLALAIALSSTAAAAAAPAPQRALTPVPFTEVRITDAFWAPRIETNRTKTIPYDFKKCEETGRISNFAKAAGQMEGKFQGIFFDDSDVYKVIEGAAYALAAHPDPALERYVDGVIAKIAAAQQPDGYLYTFYTVNKTLNLRWTDTRSKHELYCAGHLFEAAAAHFRATGKRTLLDVAVKLADNIDSVFGPGRNQYTSGHEEIELALVKLYEVTGQERYLKLAKFFLDQRGNAAGHKLYGPYSQDHKPVIEQDEPVGHAVRAMYLYCGMADVAALTDAPGYRAALDKIWTNVTTKKMYLTGGVGARHAGEAFGDAYELPNETAYCETCAAIGFALWAHRMNLATADARYADVLERVLYNGFLSGVSLDGEKFFYVNPLASDGRHHRQPWFGCACCPVNVARIMPSLPGYVAAVDAKGGVYVNLYAAGTARVARKGGAVTLAQETRYPWDGKVKLTVTPEKPATFALGLRIPGWTQPTWHGHPARDDGVHGQDARVTNDALYCSPPLAAEPAVTLKVNGQAVAPLDMRNGYARLTREWKAGDVVELDLPMPVRRMVAHSEVKADVGRVALQRGPLVYCFEAVDNGPALRSVYVPADAAFAADHRADLLGGVTVLCGKGMVRGMEGEPAKSIDLTAIPYYAWDHRAAGAMTVWPAEKPEVARPVPRPTIAGTARASTSHAWHMDTADAMNDGVEPANSVDHSIPRLTWWDHQGTTEWVQYDFAKSARVADVEVYWFDDTGRGACRTPKAWRVLYRAGGQWKPVEDASPAGIERDKFNRVTFKPVETDALRLEVDLQPKFSGGILEWRVGEAK